VAGVGKGRFKKSAKCKTYLLTSAKVFWRIKKTKRKGSDKSGGIDIE